MDVRQRANGGENNPLIIDLGGSNTAGSKQRKGNGIRTAPPKQQIRTITPLLIVLGIVMLFSVGGIAIIIVRVTGGVQNDGTGVRATDIDTDRIEALVLERDMLKEELRDTMNQLVSLNNNPQNEKKSPDTDSDTENETVQRLVKYKHRMHEEIQTISKRELMKKYGAGPHFVEINVEFNPQSNIYSTDKPGGTIKIELAPVDEMPATVYHFLEQVTSGLMNGCSFHRNAGHVVQGGPASNFIQPQAKHKDFRVALLDSVPFQE
jgi:Cyclophilin type peptidyl-prolyl cis-trans isomerase/CLD